MNAHSLPVRTSICLLAVLLTLTPVSQVMAQTAQQEQQQSEATQSGKQDKEPDKAAILRPDATAIFPVADSADSVAVVPAAAKMSSAGWAVIGILIAIAVLLVLAARSFEIYSKALRG